MGVIGQRKLAMILIEVGPAADVVLTGDDVAREVLHVAHGAPIDPEPAQAAIESACRRLGTGLHLRIYLEALQDHLVRIRTKKGEKKP